jgi:hypothetical protein
MSFAGRVRRSVSTQGATQRQLRPSVAPVLGAEALDDGLDVARSTFAEGAGARWGVG